MTNEPNRVDYNNEAMHDAELGISANLQSLINACKDVEEFRSLLQNRGIWLNRKAAETAFHALQGVPGGKLDDDELDMVFGGMTVLAENGDFLKALLNCLR